MKEKSSSSPHAARFLSSNRNLALHSSSSDRESQPPLRITFTDPEAGPNVATRADLPMVEMASLFMKQVLNAFILYHLSAIGHVCGEAGLAVAARLTSPRPLDRLAPCQHPSVLHPTTSFAARVVVTIMLGILSLCATAWLGAAALDPCVLIAASITLALAINLVEHVADLVAPFVFARAPQARPWAPKRALTTIARTTRLVSSAIATALSAEAGRHRDALRNHRRHRQEGEQVQAPKSHGTRQNAFVQAMRGAQHLAASVAVVILVVMFGAWRQHSGFFLCAAATACPPVAPFAFVVLARRAERRRRNLPRRPRVQTPTRVAPTDRRAMCVGDAAEARADTTASE